MTSRAKLFLPILAGLAGAAAAPLPAAAQCRLCETPTTETVAIEGSAALMLEVETRLSFDQIVLFGEGDGTATIRPDGTKSASGSVDSLNGRAMAGVASVRGEPNRLVRVELPTRITLHSLDGAALEFDEIVSDLPAMPKLDAAGLLTFRFGGRLTVRGDAEGDYRGEVPIDVEYE